MKVAFRIDDVTTHMDWDKFDRLAALFDRYGVRPLLGVIPDNRDPALLKLPDREDGWARIRALRDRGWPVAQHGLYHVYTTAASGLLGINDRSEFAGVGYETQLDMLSEGKKLLEERGLPTDIFMAPAHSYDHNTLKALRALGFRYVSDGYSLRPYRRWGLKFIPCQTAAPRRIPFGLQTVCLHPNTMREEMFGSLENWLKRSGRRVCAYSAALETPGLGFLSLAAEKLILAMRKVKKSASPGAPVTRQARNIAVFTSNYQGGVFQFALYLAEVLARQGFNVHAFVPESASEGVPASVTVHRYRRFKNVRPKNKYAAALARQVADCFPDRVLFCDDTIISEQVMLALDRRTATTQFVHDVSPHPAWFNLYEWARTALGIRYRSAALNRAGQIILLSQNSFERFRTEYPKRAGKAAWMRLGAHLPEADPVMPPGLPREGLPAYYLFFGRIDKYKGIINLLRAYGTLAPALRPPLVIAGSGQLQDDEEKLVGRNDGVVLLNRFISNAEMLWLIQHALTVVLPYTEASQSGVLPIAYHFGVPVVTSNVPGLTEFVEDSAKQPRSRPVSRSSPMALLKITDPALRESSAGTLRFSKEKRLGAMCETPETDGYALNASEECHESYLRRGQRDAAMAAQPGALPQAVRQAARGETVAVPGIVLPRSAPGRPIRHLRRDEPGLQVSHHGAGRGARLRLRRGPHPRRARGQKHPAGRLRRRVGD
jgi:glycosyltransferase involved in cell wall biosynthesis